MNNQQQHLVTGGTGLVGAHLLAHLVLQGRCVRAIHRHSSDFSGVKQVFGYYTTAPDDMFNAIEWLEADLLDVPALEIAFKDISLVYHCAGLVTFDDNLYQTIRSINVEGTANMVNLALAKAVDKFCYVSSIATLDNQIKTNPITEQNYWNPSNNKIDYALTKYGGEMEVWRGTQEGLKAVIVNPGVILGSGFWQKNSGLMFSRINNGFNYYTKGITGFVGVWDVVKLMVELMDSDHYNNRYVLVSENLSYKTVFTSIAQAMGKPKPKRYVTPLISQIAWRLESLKAFITKKPASLTKHSAQSAHDVSFYNSDKIKDTLVFDFEPIEKIIKHCVDDFNK